MADLRAPLILRNLLGDSRLNDIPWKPYREGIEIHELYATPGGSRAALLRYAPGASLPRHFHTGYEHIMVLSGAQTDDASEYQSGSLLINPPGTTHAVTSQTGCIVLAIWERAVQFE